MTIEMIKVRYVMYLIHESSEKKMNYIDNGYRLGKRQSTSFFFLSNGQEEQTNKTQTAFIIIDTMMKPKTKKETTKYRIKLIFNLFIAQSV